MNRRAEVRTVLEHVEELRRALEILSAKRRAVQRVREAVGTDVPPAVLIKLDMVISAYGHDFDEADALTQMWEYILKVLRRQEE